MATVSSSCNVHIEYFAYSFVVVDPVCQEVKKSSHSLRRYYCDVTGFVSTNIRAVLRANGINLSPLSKMRFLEYTADGQV